MTHDEATAVAAQVQALGYDTEICDDADSPVRYYVRVLENGRYFISIERANDFTEFAQRYGCPNDPVTEEGSVFDFVEEDDGHDSADYYGRPNWLRW